MAENPGRWRRPGAVGWAGLAGAVRFFKSGRIVVVNSEGPAEIRVAGKTITGKGAFTVTIDGPKAESKTLSEDAEVNVR